MESKLLLLTGPAAGEVARVLQAGMAIADPRQGASCDPWWDEVRDYWEAPTLICSRYGEVSGRPAHLEAAIRSIPRGEEWLVGLVMPDLPRVTDYHPWPGLACDNHPARLAILAPEPPPLLVERVRSWGGEMWHCRHDSAQSEKCTCRITAHVPGVGHDVRYQGYFATWPEAVRAALGES